MIEITSRVDNYCRCTTLFGKKARTFEDNKFTPSQLFVLKHDPMLTVKTVSAEDAEKQAQKKAAEEAEAAKIAAEQEAARKATEEAEAARIAAEQEAARVAEDAKKAEEKARKAAQAKAKREAAKKKKAAEAKAAEESTEGGVKK